MITSYYQLNYKPDYGTYAKVMTRQMVIIKGIFKDDITVEINYLTNQA